MRFFGEAGTEKWRRQVTRKIRISNGKVTESAAIAGIIHITYRLYFVEPSVAPTEIQVYNIGEDIYFYRYTASASIERGGNLWKEK